MKCFKILVLCFGFMTSAQGQASELKHTYKKNETLWFLAQLYYGKGAEYKKIMQKNSLTSPDQIQEGTVLVIENYRFGDDAHFLQKRYEDLMEKRERILQLNHPSSITRPNGEKAQPEAGSGKLNPTTSIEKVEPVVEGQTIEQTVEQTDGMKIQIKKIPYRKSSQIDFRKKEVENPARTAIQELSQ